jgi:hypothetical protein
MACYYQKQQQKDNIGTDTASEIESWTKFMCVYLNANNHQWLDGFKEW